MMRASRGPWVMLFLLAAFLLLLPILGGFLVIATISSILGWIMWSLRGRTSGLEGVQSQPRVVVLDENHRVLRTED